mgnify:CR=1 FL=1
MKEFFISSPDDERVADFIGLSNHKLRQIREKEGGDMAPYFIGEGVIVINRALAVGHVILTLIVNEKFDQTQLAAIPKECNYYRCSPEVLEAITGTQQQLQVLLFQLVLILVLTQVAQLT